MRDACRRLLCTAAVAVRPLSRLQQQQQQQVMLAAAAAAREQLSTKCDYVKALYGGGAAVTGQQQGTTVGDCRRRQAAMVALQNFLHYRRGLPLDDAVFVSSAAPRFIERILLLQHQQQQQQQQEQQQTMMMSIIGEDSSSFEQIRAAAEAALQQEAVDEMEPFLESIGCDAEEARRLLLPDNAGSAPRPPPLTLTGEAGLLSTAKLLEEEARISRRSFWRLLAHDKRRLHYTAADCRAALAALASVGILPEGGSGVATLRAVLEACPAAFTAELADLVRPIVERLERLGIGAEAVGAVIAGAPTRLAALLGAQPETLAAELEAELGLDAGGGAELLRRQPLLLVGCSGRKAAEVARYLRGEALLLEEHEVAALALRYPRLLLLGLERGVRSKVAFLQGELGMQRAALKRALLERPEVLGFGLEDNLKPKVAFLESIGLDRRQLGLLLGKRPWRLLHSLLANDVKRKANFLVTSAGVLQSEVGAVVYAYPLLVALRLPDVRERLRRIRASLGCDVRGVGSMVARHPPLLNVDASAVPGVVKLLRKELCLAMPELRRLLMARPALLLWLCGSAEEAGAEKQQEVLEERRRKLCEMALYLERRLGFRRGSEWIARALARCALLPVEQLEERMRRVEAACCYDGEVVRVRTAEEEVRAEEVRAMVRSNLRLLCKEDDEEWVERVAFCVAELGLGVGELVRQPRLLHYSVERVVRPRHRLISWLQARHVVRRDYAPAVYLHMPRQQFEDTFLHSHPLASDVYHGRLDVSAVE